MPELTKGDIKARAFLAAFRITASVTAAARAVPMDKSMHYRWLLQSPRYAKAFAQAKIEAAQALEDEAVERATIGVFEPTVYQGEFTYPWIEAVDPDTGEVIMEPEVLDPETGAVITKAHPRIVRSTVPVGVYKKSDVLLSKLLNGFMPEKYSTKVSAEIAGPGGGPIAIGPSRLDSLSDDELASLKALVGKLALDDGDRGPGAQAEQAED